MAVKKGDLFWLSLKPQFSPDIKGISGLSACLMILLPARLYNLPGSFGSDAEFHSGFIDRRGNGKFIAGRIILVSIVVGIIAVIAAVSMVAKLFFKPLMSMIAPVFLNPFVAVIELIWPPWLEFDCLDFRSAKRVYNNLFYLIGFDLPDRNIIESVKIC